MTSTSPTTLSSPRTVQVFILLGQSNMVGMGKVAGDADGSLEYAVQHKGRYPWLVCDSQTDNTTTTTTSSSSSSGNWKPSFCCHHRVRHVFVMGSGDASDKGKLLHNEWISIKNCSKIGPEMGIAYELDQIQSPSSSSSSPAPPNDILVLKSCIGNRSIGWDLLPPGSPSFLYHEDTDAINGGKKVCWHYAGYKESPARWEVGTKPERSSWYAGCQYDGDVARAKTVLNDLSKYVPPPPATKGARSDSNGRTNNNDDDDNDDNDDVSYDVAGFFFWQGDKDRYDAAYATHYQKNLANLIRQLRIDFDAPNANFVLATLGQTSWQDANSPTNPKLFNDSRIFKAQMAVAELPEFKNNVACVYSHPFSHGGASNGHYNANAETYMDIGQAMGRAMVKLLEGQGHEADLFAAEEEDGDVLVDDGWVLLLSSSQLDHSIRRTF